MLRDSAPELYAKLRLHFVGTSNQSVGGDERVMPVAREVGVAEVVREITARVLPYSEIVRIQGQATALLALGSSEPHYTASKIFPLLLARRPFAGGVSRGEHRHESSAPRRPPAVDAIDYL